MGVVCVLPVCVCALLLFQVLFFNLFTYEKKKKKKRKGEKE